MRSGGHEDNPEQPSVFARWWPLLVAWGVLLLCCGALWLRALPDTEGHCPYTLDDSYIHMAMAKHFAADGVWGVTPYEFTSTSSSPLWTALLAGLYCFCGPREAAPLIMNIVAALALLGLLHEVLRRAGSRPLLTLGALLLAIFLVPLPPILFCGLEHPLHMLLIVALVLCVVRSLYPTEARPGAGGSLALCGALAALAVMSRYESAFVVLVLMALAVWRRHWSVALLLGCATAAPLLGYGVWCASHGWPMVPTSILMKAARPEFSLSGLLHFLVGDTPKGAVGLKGILVTPHMLSLCLLLLAAWIALRCRPTAEQKNSLVGLPGIVLAATLLHMQFAQVGWFYRYEGYLLVLGLLTLALVMCHGNGARLCGWRSRWLALGLLALAPFVTRAWQAFRDTPRAARNIHEQQYQMGLFLRAHYNGEAIAANDIGAINFLADLHLLDIHGMGTLAVFEAKRNRSYGPQVLERLARERGVRMAVIYPDWLDRKWGGVPPNWQKVGTWSIEDNVICAGETVAFFAVPPAAPEVLQKQLEVFLPRLPRHVHGVAQ